MPKSRAGARATLIEVPRPPQLLSNPGEKVILAGVAAAFLSVLIFGFAILRAPTFAELLPASLVLLFLISARKDFIHVRRHGWGDGGNDGPGGGGLSGPREPVPSGPPGDGEQFDWDAFTVQFRDHVERQPVSSRG